MADSPSWATKAKMGHHNMNSELGLQIFACSPLTSLKAVLDKVLAEYESLSSAFVEGPQQLSLVTEEKVYLAVLPDPFHFCCFHSSFVVKSIEGHFNGVLLRA